MGTSTIKSSDPRTPVQKRGNILVLFVVVAMVGAIVYGYVYANASKNADHAAPQANPEPVTQATPVTQQ